MTCDPERRLPPELLSEVFIHCLPSSGLPGLDRLAPPLTLTQVNRAWRDASLSTPQLWSSLHIHRRLYVTPVADFMHAIHLWLGRSGDLPLRLGIAIAYQHKTTARLTMDTLALYAERWHAIDLTMIPAEYSYLLSLCDRLPSLHRLRITLLHASTNTAAFRLETFRNAPMLRDVEFENVPLACFDLPWLQLQRICVTGLSIAGHRQILQDCPNLRSFQATVNPDFNPPFALSVAPVYHPTLEEYSVQWWSGQPMDPVLSQLTAPSLTTLSIEGSLGLWNDSAFITFIRLSSLSLLVLSLQSVTVSPDALVECLTLTRALEELTLRKLQTVDARVLQSLAYADGQPALLPRLRTLRLLELHLRSGNSRRKVLGRDRAVDEAETGEIVALIQSRRVRRDDAVRLRTVVLGSSMIHPKVIAEAKVWRSEGMQVDLGR